MARAMRTNKQAPHDEAAAARRAPKRAVEAPPGDLRNLQRSIGNRAAGQVLRSLLSSGAAVPVQRVGGTKLGFDLVDPLGDVDIATGQQLLTNEWDQIRQAEHNLKVGAEKTDVEAGAQEMINVRARRKEREDYKTSNPLTYATDIDTRYPEITSARVGRAGFSKFYYDKLTKNRRDQRRLLLAKSTAFNKGLLRLETDGTIKYRSAKTKPFKVVGTLKEGDAAFAVKTAQGTAGNTRDILKKHGVTTGYNTNEAKEYVRDSRGVLTRRYAYVEKNYWQAMEFFMMNRHEGRFQTFMKAAGEANPDLYEARQEEVDLVRGQVAASTTGRLTKKQMAVSHQKLGSGPQQRGVSLTSTPKVGVTYVNTGENFRTARGFRFKVDLAKIPLNGPLLINHYSEGGVIDKPDKYSTLRKRGERGNYPYLESAVHARELYLEYLDPSWIVAIEQHPTVGGASTTIDRTTPLGLKASLFELGKSQFGGDDFQRGFDAGLVSPTNLMPGNQDHDDGFKHARSFVRGWTAGSAISRANDATNAGLAGVTLPQYVYDQSMAVDLPTGEFDIYRVGYLQGRSGAGLIASGANLPH
jgi:hypothetical protein